MAIAREAEPSGSLGEAKEWGLDREDLLTIYRNMLTTRGLEERGHILYKQGKIPGSFYTGRGNEAAAVGVATAMQPDDVGAPLHRDLGVHIVRGLEPWRIFANYMGRVDGPRSEEHTSELQSRQYLVCRLLLEKKKKHRQHPFPHTKKQHSYRPQ